LNFDTYKSSPEPVEAAVEHDQSLGSVLLGLFGLEPDQPVQTSKTLNAEELKLCSTCEAEVTKWTEALDQRTEEEAEEEFRSRVVYEALACFATGALVGIMFGILRD